MDFLRIAFIHGIWLLDLTFTRLLDSVKYESGTFIADFVSSFVIKGRLDGIYLWNKAGLCVGTLCEHLKGFLWGICFRGSRTLQFYWQVIQEHSLRTLQEILGTILSGFCLNFMRSKVSVNVFFLFSWLAVFPVTDFNLCNLEPIATAWFVISWLIFLVNDWCNEIGIVCRFTLSEIPHYAL